MVIFLRAGLGVDSIGGPFYVFFTLSGKRRAGSGVCVMSDIKSKKFIIKLFIIFSFTLVNIGCANIVTHTVTTYDSKTQHPITSTTQYEVAFNGDSPQHSISFSTLKEAQDYAKQSAAFIFTSQTVESRYQTLTNLSSNTNATTQTQQASITQQTSVQQDITSTGNSTTQTPLPQSVCNMMINGQCNPNTVTAVTAVVGVAVIGGITAAVVSAVNNQAQQQQEQQKSKDLWNVLIINQSKKGSSCQCSDPVGANFCGFNVCGP